jgi:hypothetical protein
MVVIYHHHYDAFGDVMNDRTCFLWSLALDEFGFEIPLPLCGRDGSDAMENAHYSMTCDGVH